MERRFFMNDFEQSLKEHADNFQMIPSKKVWHGIYNDLHPGKRWPSVTMSLLLIFALVTIGHLNTNNSRRLAYLANNKSSDTKKLATSLKTTGSSTSNQKIVVRKSDVDKSREVFVYSNGQPGNTEPALSKVVINYQNNDLLKGSSLSDRLKSLNNPVLPSFEKNLIVIPEPNFNSGDGNIAENEHTKATLLQNNIDLKGSLEEKIANHVDKPHPGSTLAEKENKTTAEELPGKGAKEINTGSNAEKKTVKPHRKRNDKIGWVYYAAPVLNSVSFSGEPLKEPQGSNFAAGPVINPKPNKILHSSALGFEAGAQMNYAITKSLKFTTGAHLTYSGYNIISNEVHPFRAVLVLRDPGTGTLYSRNFITHYGDGTGQSVAMIRNYNWQASIPFGLQYEVTGNDKVQFNVGGNVEPSLILKSKAYILSSDGNNYVNDPSLLRKLNVSSNFGAFVTFSSTRFKWQIGPNIRYQWLSTYLRDYTVKEHLIDYGIRLGISR